MKFFDVQQGSEEWHAIRRGVPTASNFDRIITPKTRRLSGQVDGLIAELIGDKLSVYGPERPESYTSNAMRFGQETEAEARRFYSMERSLDVTNGGFCLSDDDRFGASPDGLVGGEGSLELKCPLAKTHTAYLLDGTLPDDYRPQVHGQLIVTGRKWVDFLSYAPGLPPLLVRVEPDEFTDQLRVALEIFWGRFQRALAKIQQLA